MKKLLPSLFIVFALLFVSPIGIAKAAYTAPFEDVCNSSTVKQAGDSTVCNNKDNTDNPISGTNGIIIKTVRLLSFVTGIASVLIMLVAGLKYITSNGDSSSINSSKNTILYALVGLVVSLLSQGIIAFIINGLN